MSFNHPALRRKPSKHRQPQPISGVEFEICCTENVATRLLSRRSSLVHSRPQNSPASRPRCLSIRLRGARSARGTAVAEALREEHDRLVTKRVRARVTTSPARLAGIGTRGSFSRVVAASEASRRQAMANRHLPAAHITGQAGKSQTPADVAAQINNQSITPLPLLGHGLLHQVRLRIPFPSHQGSMEFSVDRSSVRSPSESGSSAQQLAAVASSPSASGPQW